MARQNEDEKGTLLKRYGGYVPVIALLVAIAALIFGTGYPRKLLYSPDLRCLSYPPMHVGSQTVGIWMLKNEGRADEWEILLHVSVVHGSLIEAVSLQSEQIPRPSVRGGGKGYDYVTIFSEVLQEGNSIFVSVVVSNTVEFSSLAHSKSGVAKPYSIAKGGSTPTIVIAVMATIVCMLLIGKGRQAISGYIARTVRGTVLNVLKEVLKRPEEVLMESREPPTEHDKQDHQI
jgi:hypothetical protein